MKTKYILGLALAAVAFTSCSEDIMDKINTNEENPELSVVDGKLMLTDAITATSYSLINGNYAWYVASYTEQIGGTGNNQLKNAELRKTAELASSTTFNNEWNSTYGNLLNLHTIRNKCQAGGTNDSQQNLLGMAQTLEALNLGVLTDMHGDIPYSESFGDIFAPKIDTQKEIYDRIFVLLDSAQVNFAAGKDKVGANDILYGGDVNKWKAFAHALKARYLLHTQAVSEGVMDKVLAEAQAAVSSGFDGANLDIFNGTDKDNSWSAYHFSRQYSASTTTVHNLMTERKDPRDSIYVNEEAGKLLTPGNTADAMATAGLGYPAWLDNGAAYQHIFSKSELYFILAEAQVRTKKDAKDAFVTAVKASIDDFFTVGGEKLSAEEKTKIETDYLAVIEPLFTANPLKELFVQKYLAQTRDEQLETFNDMRRCKKVDGSYAVAMTNPLNTQGGSNRWPLRLPYGDSDITSNPNVAKAFGTGNDAGMYIFTQPVWWAGGTQ